MRVRAYLAHCLARPLFCTAPSHLCRVRVYGPLPCSQSSHPRVIADMSAPSCGARWRNKTREVTHGFFAGLGEKLVKR